MIALGGSILKISEIWEIMCKAYGIFVISETSYQFWTHVLNGQGPISLVL